MQADFDQQEKRRARRIDTKLVIGYQSKTGHTVPAVARHVNISATGIAFEIGELATEWVERVDMVIEYQTRKVTLEGRFVRHVLGKEGWMAFEFCSFDQSLLELVSRLEEDFQTC